MTNKNGSFESLAIKIENDILNESRNHFGKLLFQNGFLGLDADLVKKIIDAHSYILWGGNWRSSKDFMHFSIKTANQEKLHKELSIEEINTYVKRFKND